MYGPKVMPFTAILDHLCRDGEHKQVDLAYRGKFDAHAIASSLNIY